jgi:DNA-binding MarR family transcriptional regulator
MPKSSKKRLAQKPTPPAEKALAPRLNTKPLDRSIGYSLRRAQFSTYGKFSEAMGPFDVRPSQYAVLVLIRANPGSKQSAIGSALGIQKTNFVTLLDKLESRGLTERRKVRGDRRSSALHLTPKGEVFVTAMEAAHSAMEKALAGRLGVGHTRDLLNLLHRFGHKEPLHLAD